MTQDYFAEAFEGTWLNARGKNGMTTFFSSLLRNHEKRKNTPEKHQRGYRKKNITCEIRCLLLHLNVPSVVLY